MTFSLRHLACAALFAASVSSLLDPGAFAGDLAAVRVRVRAEAALDADARAALARLNGVAQRPFTAIATPSGRARRLVDGRVLLAGVRDDAVREFLETYAALFGYDARLEPRIVTRGRVTHVVFARLGLRVLGAGAALRFDGDFLTDATFVLPDNVAVRGMHALSDGAAVAQSRSIAGALRTRRGRTSVASWREGRTERVWRARADGLRAAFLVEALPDLIAQEQAIVLDAQNGDCLDVVDLACSAQGLYPAPGFTTVPFTTGGGSGRVFKNVKDARAGKAKSGSLSPLGRGVPSASVPDGLLVGAFADVYTDGNFAAFSPSHSFKYSPFGADEELFDQANVYFHITQFRRHLNATLGPDLAGNHSLPVIVNVDNASPNAFFSPTAFPDNHTDGWLVFFQVPSKGDEGDLSRDPTVVAHEYTHAWLWFELLDFNGALNDPARAVNEAFADWFSLCFHKDTVIGRYTDDVYPEFAIGRDLADDDHFPETTQEASALPWSNTGLPEEHRNGEVFGSFLMDVRRMLGTKAAETFVFAAMPAMPHTIADAGIVNYNAGTSLAASGAYFDACAVAAFDTATTGKQRGAVLGATAARGIANVNVSGAVLYSTDLTQEPKAKLTIPSEIVVAGDEHVFALVLPQTGPLTIKLAAAKGSSARPDFTITDELGAGGAVTETKVKALAKGGAVVTQKGLVKNLPAGAVYLIRVTGTAGTTGRYTLNIDA